MESAYARGVMKERGRAQKRLTVERGRRAELGTRYRAVVGENRLLRKLLYDLALEGGSGDCICGGTFDNHGQDAEYHYRGCQLVKARRLFGIVL